MADSVRLLAGGCNAFRPAAGPLLAQGKSPWCPPESRRLKAGPTDHVLRSRSTLPFSHIAKGIVPLHDPSRMRLGDSRGGAALAQSV
jgi:hypothetical protein